jgi:hypothetical protein
MQLLKLLSLGPTTRQLLMGWFDHPIPYVHKETGYVVLQHARFRTIFNRIFVALTVMALIFQALWPTKSDMVESISILLMIPAFSIILNFLFLKMFDLADERFIKDFLLLCKELSLTPQELAVTDPHKVPRSGY